jgi:protein-S-isoprenylcysteine O-methyltransferase Ste14
MMAGPGWRVVRALELKIPPLPLTLVCGTLMWLVSTVAPALALAVPWRVPIAWIVVAAGAGIVIAGVLEFRRAHTTVNPIRPDAAFTVVTSGIYGFSRNPMYVGLLLVLAGWALCLAHLLPFLLLPGFVLYMNRFQIRPEERALSAQFGVRYDAYRQSVRRWL